MAQIIVPIPDEYLAPIAAALRPQVADADALSDADIIERFARGVIETLVVQAAGQAAIATLDAQRETTRREAEDAARAMLAAVRAADA